jgi:hypothetical protein
MADDIALEAVIRMGERDTVVEPRDTTVDPADAMRR